MFKKAFKKVEDYFHREFGKCLPVVENSVQEASVCTPDGQTEKRQLKVAIASCEKCKRTLGVYPMGFAD